MRRRRDSLIDHSAILVALALLVVAAIVGISAHQAGEQFGANIATELASIAITVIVIDRLYQMRSSRDYKRQIVLQMGSKANDAALEAVRIARLNGWMTDGSLRGRNFYEANLSAARLDSADFTGAVLAHTDLLYAFLVEARCQEADFHHADLTNAVLVSTDFRGANLYGADISDAALMDADLTGANLVNADLRRADLTSALLGDAALEKAIYDSETVWPENFHPNSAGMLNWDEMTDEEQEQWWQTKYYCHG